MAGFDLAGLFTCPSPTTLVYIVATGGNPGFAAPTSNAQSGLIAALGECGNQSTSAFISLNEVTTVAAVYALAPFMRSATEIGSGTSDAPALASAFALAMEYANWSTGSTPGTGVPAGTVVPVAQINTIANILATCVNTAGGVAGDGSVCGNFLALTTPTGVTPPTDTIVAMLNLANNPGLNTQGLYNLMSATPPFQPVVGVIPPDLGVRLTVPSNFTVSPNPLAFGPVMVGFTSGVETVTVTNGTAGEVGVFSQGITGTNASDFTLQNGCSTPMAAGTSCTYTFTFTPSAALARTAYFILNNTSENTSEAVLLTGTGTEGTTAGPITLLPSTLDFTYGGQTHDLTLTNYGNTTLTLGRIGISSLTFNGTPETDPGTISNTFTVGNNCGGSLAPQSVCTISVRSGSIGESNANLTVFNDGLNNPILIPLTGENYTAGPITGGNFGSWTVGAHSGLLSEGVMIDGDSEITVSGPNASDFIVSSAICSPGNHGISNICPYTVYFKPTGAGLRTATISLRGGSAVNSTDVLQGIGLTDPMSFEAPSALSFTTTLGSTVSQDLVITFNGTINPSLGTPVISGPDVANLTFVQQTCGGPCVDYNLNFTATTLGTSVDTISFTNNPLTIPVYVRVGYPPPTATLRGLTFSTPPGTISQSQSFSVSSTQHPVTVAISGPFLLTNGSSCSATPCSLSVAFEPGNTITYANGLVTITDVLTHLKTTVQLAGIPVYTTSVNFSPPSITFPLRSVHTTSIAQTVTLTNMGSYPLNITSLGLAGANPGDYVFQNVNCGSTLAASAQCSVTVSFAPTAPGTRTATIQLVSNSSSSPDTVTLSGTAQ